MNVVSEVWCWVTGSFNAGYQPVAGAWGTEFSYLEKGWQDLGRASGSQASMHTAEFWP